MRPQGRIADACGKYFFAEEGSHESFYAGEVSCLQHTKSKQGRNHRKEDESPLLRSRRNLRLCVACSGERRVRTELAFGNIAMAAYLWEKLLAQRQATRFRTASAFAHCRMPTGSLASVSQNLCQPSRLTTIGQQPVHCCVATEVGMLLQGKTVSFTAEDYSIPHKAEPACM